MTGNYSSILLYKFYAFYETRILVVKYNMKVTRTVRCSSCAHSGCIWCCTCWIHVRWSCHLRGRMFEQTHRRQNCPDYMLKGKVVIALLRYMLTNRGLQLIKCNFILNNLALIATNYERKTKSMLHTRTHPFCLSLQIRICHYSPFFITLSTVICHSVSTWRQPFLVNPPAVTCHS